MLSDLNLMTLLGGLALFLYGMELLTGGLKAAAGDGLRRMLASLTGNRFSACLTGGGVTAVIQSSSVTTVLVVGFISAGLMSLEQSLGVIIGAKVGTTITAQVIAFKVTHYALAMIAAGFAISMLIKRERVKPYGTMLMGLGLLFFGMDLMGEATRPLRDNLTFITLMQNMANPLLGIVIAALFTAVVQSSSATIGIVVMLASEDMISLEAGIALAFGANIGTCVTAGLAAIGKPREAVRAALFHVLFTVLGVMAWLGLIPWLAAAVLWISPPDDTARQVANAHTLFNLGNAIVFIGFTPVFAWLLRRLVPDKPSPKPVIGSPRYLDRTLFSTPSLALDRVRLEIAHMAEITGSMLEQAQHAVISGTNDDLAAAADLETSVDHLQHHILSYLRSLGRQGLEAKDSATASDFLRVTGYLESIADSVEGALLPLGHTRARKQITISPATEAALTAFTSDIIDHFRHAAAALAHPNSTRAALIMTAKTNIEEHYLAIGQRLDARLHTDDPNRLSTYTWESDLIDRWKYLFTLTKRIARLLE